MRTRATIGRRAILIAGIVGPLHRAYAQTSGTAMAVVADTTDGGGPGGGTFFMLTGVDGSEVATTALKLSVSASRGKGPYMEVRGAERPVPSGKVALSLHGIQTHAAPISTIFRAVFKGGDPEVKGTVSVELAPGQRYRASGILDAYRREIWLEDAQGTVVLGSSISAPADPELLKEMNGATFTTTNLRYDDDWIGDGPRLQLPFIPVGSRLKVLDWGSNRAGILVDGHKMRIGVDWTRDKQTIQQFASSVTSMDDPRTKISGFPERVRSAIAFGRVFVGMTRDQVRIALGRPRLDFTPNLDANEWKYQGSDQEELFVAFDSAGLLKELDASRRLRSLVQFEAYERGQRKKATSAA